MPLTVRWYKPVLILLCLLLLSGCADADMHVTVNWDGSGTYQIKVLSHPLVMQELESFKEALQQKGYNLQPIQEGKRIGWIATRLVENVAQDPPGEDIMDLLSTEGKTAHASPYSLLNRVDNGPIQVDSNLFRIHITFYREFDLTALTESSIRQAFINEMNLTFRLTVPLIPDQHNADQVSADGRTLTWNLQPEQVESVQVEWDIPNPITVSILVLFAFVLLLVLITTWIIRRGRRKRLS